MFRDFPESRTKRAQSNRKYEPQRNGLLWFELAFKPEGGRPGSRGWVRMRGAAKDCILVSSFVDVIGYVSCITYKRDILSFIRPSMRYDRSSVGASRVPGVYNGDRDAHKDQRPVPIPWSCYGTRRL